MCRSAQKQNLIGRERVISPAGYYINAYTSNYFYGTPASAGPFAVAFRRCRYGTILPALAQEGSVAKNLTHSNCPRSIRLRASSKKALTILLRQRTASAVRKKKNALVSIPLARVLRKLS